MEDDQGDSILVGSSALGNLFALHKEDVKCVVLNACYSAEQASSIGEHIPFVIGMTSTIDDASALAFAVGFYDAIGAGRNIEQAFRHGCNAIELQGLPGHELPMLKTNTGVAQIERTSVLATAASLRNQARDGTALFKHRQMVQELLLAGLEATRCVQCVGMHNPVPFEQIYQPTKILMRSGLDISASGAFHVQNRIAQSIVMSRAESFAPSSMEDFLDYPEDSIISAGPGWGKTTFLHYLFREKVKDKSIETILITLRREDALAKLEEITKFYSLPASSIDDRRVLLLVDGYDEVSLAARRKVSACLNRFSEAKQGRFILSCRDHYEVFDLKASQVRIDAFDIQDKYKFVSAFLLAMDSSQDARTMVNELESRNFSDFLSHPLLLALACIVKIGCNKEEARSTLRLLSRALTTLQHNWDAAKGVSRQRLTKLDGEDRIQILKRVAFASRSAMLKGDRAVNITRKALGNMQLEKVEPLLVLGEIAQFYGILTPSRDGWEFVHRTIHDYLAALYWVESGGFATQNRFEWDTRTAYAACISADATRVLEGALASRDGLTCAIEILTNSPNFDFQKIGEAVHKFYLSNDRVSLFERGKSSLRR